MKTNKDLKNAGIPHCDWRDFIKYTGEGELPAKDQEALDQYFQNFCPPGVCIKCGHKQGTDGSITSYLLNDARFKWGLQNGEGYCSTGGCNWPARGVHRNVGPIQSLNLILQYHPDVVTWDE